jgi:predicted AAA+ superfamily ATPase
MEYLPRALDSELDMLLEALPAVAIEGTKGVGKTAIATRRAKSVFALDRPQDLALATANPERLLEAEPPVLIDEWQRLPETWDMARRAVDDGAPKGSYLLTGSTSPRGLGTHSGAGRIPILRMRPLSLDERSGNNATVSLARLLEGNREQLTGETEMRLEGYAEEILASGFPGLRGLPGPVLRTQLDGYIDRIVDRDFPELDRVLRDPAGLRRWMAAYAAASSTSASFERIRDAATGGSGDKPARSTAIPYRDVLERLWVLDPVPAWAPTLNYLTRLTAAPKHQLADPALAARLLKVTADDLLDGRDLGPPIPRKGPLLGILFESLVTLSVRVYAQAAAASVGHMRTFAGEREIDLIVDRGGGRVVAIEVKMAQTVKDEHVRHLTWLREQIGEDLLDAIVINTGRDAYRRRDGIGVVPAALLGP